jgi:hypothetical protein
MNLMALLNMVKLAVAATLTSLLAVTIGATKTIAWISSSQARLIALGAAIPILSVIDARAVSQYASIRGDAEAVLRAADRAQQTLRDRLPEIAEAQAGQALLSYRKPVRRGFSPMRPLPVRRGSTAELCARALPFDRPMALDTFDPVEPAPARLHARMEAEAALMPSCLSLGVAAMELEPGTALGGERLQLRYYVLGDALISDAHRGVQIATWGRGAGPATDGTAGFAQAEYYFDGEGTAAQREADALFTLGWRARFRRFRTADLPGEVAAACQRAGAACANAGGASGNPAGRVAH